MKEVSFAACTDAQTAQEIDGHGQFTLRALGVLRGGLAGLTNGDFYQRVVAAFGPDSAQQTPQLDCAPASKTRALLAALDGRASSPATLDTVLSRLDDLDRRLARLER
jgi:hypothetical protein